MDSLDSFKSGNKVIGIGFEEEYPDSGLSDYDALTSSSGSSSPNEFIYRAKTKSKVIHWRHKIVYLLNTIFFVIYTRRNVHLRFIPSNKLKAAPNLKKIIISIITIYLIGSLSINYISEYYHQQSIQQSIQQSEQQSAQQQLFLLATQEEIRNEDLIISSYVQNIISKSLFPPQTLLYAPSDEEKLNLLESSNYNLKLASEHDPRLTAALWLFKVRKTIESGELNPIFLQIPFSWSNWVDLDSKLKKKYKWYNFFDKEGYTCKSFKNFYGISKILNQCIPLDPELFESDFPKFKISGPEDSPMPTEARIIYGASYLKYGATAPSRVMFLNVNKNQGSLIIPVLKDIKTGIPQLYQKIQLNKLLKEYIDYETKNQKKNWFQIVSNGISAAQEAHELINSYKKSSLNLEKEIDDFDRTMDTLKFVNNDKQESRQIQLTKDQFLWDTSKEINMIQDRIDKSHITNFLNLDLALITNMKNALSLNSQFPKYFHESPVRGNIIAGEHYDWRFFNGIDMPYYEHISVLHRLIRTWLRFSRSTGIETWIAHGTMLGWYWNGLTMPWDSDADVQMTMLSLYKLARNYNHTLIVDMTMENQKYNGIGFDSVGSESYFIDIGSSFFSRVKGNGNNAIDARFIDTKTGLYIDITALSFTDFLNNRKLDKVAREELLNVLDPEYSQKRKDKKINQQSYTQELDKLKSQKFVNKEIFNCRNDHFYSIEELSPLIPTLYEGVRGYVPNNYKKILEREYPNGLKREYFHSHNFKSGLGIWVEDRVCPKTDKTGSKCMDKNALIEYHRTNRYTSSHKKEMDLLKNGNFIAYKRDEELPPLRTDPWYLKHANKAIRYLSE